MDQRKQDLGILMASLEKFEHWRHRDADQISQKLDRGEAMTDVQIEFPEHCLEELRSVLGIVERNPDYQHLAEQVLEYYQDLTSRALSNEKRLHPGS